MNPDQIKGVKRTSEELPLEGQRVIFFCPIYNTAEDLEADRPLYFHHYNNDAYYREGKFYDKLYGAKDGWEKERITFWLPANMRIKVEIEFELHDTNVNLFNQMHGDRGLRKLEDLLRYHLNAGRRNLRSGDGDLVGKELHGLRDTLKFDVIEDDVTPEGRVPTKTREG